MQNYQGFLNVGIVIFELWAIINGDKFRDFENYSVIKIFYKFYSIIILDLYTLCDDVSLTINMGSPFTGDGLRPVMPNVIRGKKI